MTRAAWAVAAVGVFAGTGMWLAHTRGDAGTIAPRYAVVPAESNTETINAAATDVRTPKVTEVLAGPGSDRPAPPALREPIDPRTMPSSIAVPRAPAAPVPLPAASAPADRSSGAASAPEELPPPAPVIVALAPAPRPPPDRWQRLSEALARCPANDTFARTVCQESLRIESCEGFWGRVAPCPARVEREYGN